MGLIGFVKDKAVSCKKALVGAAVGAAVLGGSASTALATPPTPATMPDINMPIDVSSVVTAVFVVGGTMLLAWAGIYVGFRLANKFIKRAGSTV